MKRGDASCQVILNWVHLLKLGAVPSVFPCTKVEEESLGRAKRCEASVSGKEARSEYRCEYPSASINLGINQFSCLWGKQKSFPKTMLNVEGH